VAQVTQLSGLHVEDGTLTAEQFSRLVTALELGKFRELGTGGPVAASSKAGAKLYEGGPFKDTPLDMQRLRENMMVQDGIEQVMGHVGGATQQAPDWTAMWPYGVFRCSYEFEERPLLG